MDGMDQFRIRTDLAVEAKESFTGDDVEIKGVVVEEDYKEKTDIKITRVNIKDQAGADAMRKPIGNYITLEAKNMRLPDEDYHREISEELANHIRALLPEKKDLSVLVVGLGNRDVTPDALGPKVIGNLLITRHVFKEYGEDTYELDKMGKVSGIVPGVMAQTGMESLEIVKGVVEETKPDVVIAIDALAARSTHRLNTTIQLADTGINPGSGVGNHRIGLTKESVGVPVIAIGVPTVVDAATIVNDTMESLIQAMSTSESLKNVTESLSSFTHGEKYQLIRELIEPHIGTMFVTPKDIDETIKSLSFTISEALNIALHGHERSKLFR